MKREAFASWFSVCVAVCLSSLIVSGAENNPVDNGVLAYDRSRGGGPYGPSVTLDVCFPYYRQQPLEQLSTMIRQAGFTCAHLVDYGAECTSPERLKRHVAALKAAGVSPVLSIYPGTHSKLYAAHPEWRQRMLAGEDGKFDWRTWLCPNEPAFVAAYCVEVRRQMRECGFEGVQLAEVWFENWGGPMVKGQPNPNYACICERCIARFRRAAGKDVNVAAMLSNSESRWFFQNPENAGLYAQWVQMRVDTLQEFGKAIIGAVREENPRACVKVMYMADARVKLDAAREYLGTDLDRMVREWDADVLTFQDAWQDWLQVDLSPEFVADYGRAYKARVEKLRPGLFLMAHADIGSRPESKRSVAWIREFARETVKAGFGAPVFYEWHVSVLAAE